MAAIPIILIYKLLQLSFLRRKRTASFERRRRRRPFMLQQQRMERIRRFGEFQQRLLTFFLSMSLLLNTCNCSPIIDRRLWSRDHPDQWWKNAYRSYDDTQFIENFRLTRLTFVGLCNLLRADIEKQDTNMRSSISVERRIGVLLWVLGTNADYRTVAALFGMGRSTVCCIVQEVVKALVKRKSSFIVFPQEFSRAKD
ncbi:hypothetical protein LOTGIDRAFT_155030 [Lottia gigantea]|uniref:DUF8040 domain-containing protein n=1 Tax=Lottia gigantea TaxID=225164 RepID=V4B9G0_LOTGI|nr:hypothetical protein LOTGIDRAFT_155030 [Lottia gigantea]ESO85544.1 hypothetical protein LOTGIDRAFT_155030 [Lottia gigantea]